MEGMPFLFTRESKRCSTVGWGLIVSSMFWWNLIMHAQQFNSLRTRKLNILVRRSFHQLLLHSTTVPYVKSVISSSKWTSQYSSSKRWRNSSKWGKTIWRRCKISLARWKTDKILIVLTSRTCKSKLLIGKKLLWLQRRLLTTELRLIWIEPLVCLLHHLFRKARMKLAKNRMMDGSTCRVKTAMFLRNLQ